MSTTEVGVAYVRLLPSMDGFASAVKSDMGDVLTRQARAAGEDAGKALAKGIEDGANSADLDGISTGIGDKLKLGLGAAGLAGGALLVEGLTSAMDAESAIDRLGAQLGNAEFGKDMGKIAGNLYVDGFGESIADTGEALRKVWQNGLIPEDAADADIERVTTKLLTFSDVMEQDMDMATQAVSSMLKSGIADSSEEAFDILTRGVQQGVDKSGDLLETFQEYSTQFRDLGINATEATGLLSQGLQGGARDADTVADALKELAIRGKDGSTASAAGFEAIGLSAEKMTAKFAQGGPAAKEALGEVLTGIQNLEDPVARDAAAVALFGTKSEDLQKALLNLDLDSAAADMGDVAGSTDELGSAYDNASSKIESFKRGAMMELTEFIGNEVIPKVESLGSVWTTFTSALSGDSLGDLGGLQGLAQDVGSFIYTLQTGLTADEGTGVERVALAIRDALQQAQPVVDAFSSAWQELTGFLEEHGEVTTGIIVALAVAIGGALAVAVGGLVVSMVAAAAPFIAVGLAVAALGGGIMWLYNNVEEFRNFVNEAVPAIGELFSSAFTMISEIVTSVITAIQQAWAMWGDEIMSITGAVISFIGATIMAGLNIISGIFKLITALMRGDWSAAWEAIKQILSAALSWIGSLISTAFTLMKATISGTWSAITAIFGSQMTQIKTAVSNGITAIVNFFKGLPGSISSAVSTLANAITSPFRSAFDSIKSLWNRTVGGFSFSVPSWVPGVGGKGFSIPKMHSGGIFDAPGGEGLALLQSGEAVFTPDQQAALGSAMATAPTGTTTVIISADGADQALTEWLRRSVRVLGGGDVQMAFGR